MSLRTPVVLILFRRPESTKRAFAAIRATRPERLFLFADGPRAGHPEDRDRCAAARAVVADVDWPCTVERNFSAVNLGNGDHVTGALDHVFAAVEDAIVIEDDIVPQPSFFSYCVELLDRYREDGQVKMIAGYNALGAWPGKDAGSYFFTRYGPVWGFATWRRAWRGHDPTLARYRDGPIDGLLERHLSVPEQRAHLTWLCREHWSRPANKWDVPWTLQILLEGGFCAVPRRNLIENLGFGPGATHTRRADDPRDLPAGPIDLPLRHPSEGPSELLDERFERWQYWMNLMARFEHLDHLTAWGRALRREPHLPLPGDAGPGFSLAPLRYSEDALQLLEHVARAAPGNQRLRQLTGLFTAISAARSS